MVLIRLLYGIIFAESLIGSIIRMVNLVALPTLLALDAEVVVRAACEVAVSAIRFEYALRKGDTCRYAIALHMVDAIMFLLVDVLLLGLTTLCRCFDGK